MGGVLPMQAAEPALYTLAEAPLLPLAKMREAEKLSGVARFTAGIDTLKSAGVCVLSSKIEEDGAKPPNYNVGVNYHKRKSTEGQPGPERVEAIIGLFPPPATLDLAKDCVSWQRLSAIDVDIKKMLAANPDMSIKEATLRVFAQTGLLNKAAPPFWMSVSRSGGYHFVFLSIGPESGWNNPSKHAINGTTIDIFSGQYPSASHLIDWPTEGYIGVPLLDDPAAFIEERFGLAPDGQMWPFFQASLLAWQHDQLTLGRPGGPLLQWFVDKAGKNQRPESTERKAKPKGSGQKAQALLDDEPPEPTKEEVFKCLDDLIAIYRTRPEASPNYLTDEEMWSGLMANVKYCGEEVGAEDEVKDYWLDKFCPAAAEIYGLEFDADENEKRYNAKRAVEDDGKHINGTASLRQVVQALRKSIQQADIDNASNEVRVKGEVFLVVNKNGRQNAFCVPFGIAFPLEVTSSVLVGASGIAYSPHLKKPDFNPFRKLRNSTIRFLRDKLGVEEEDDDEIEDGGNSKFENIVAGMMLKKVRKEMPARMGIDIALTGVLGDKYEGEQKLEPLGDVVSMHNATSDIREFMVNKPVPVRDDHKALEMCKSLVLAFGADIPATTFAFRVFAHKVRWPSTHMSLLVSIMSTAPEPTEANKTPPKGGTGKGFSVCYFSDSYLLGRHSFQYNPNARFNGHEAQTLIKVWDEHPDPYSKSAATRAEFQTGIEKMKRVSADKTCEIEYKNENIAKGRNSILYIMLTNAATGAGNQQGERRILTLCSVAADSMPPEERVALGKRLEQPDYKNAVLELISRATPLSESECKFAPRTEHGKRVSLEAESRASPVLDALIQVAGETKLYDRAQHGESLQFSVEEFTLEALASKVNDVLNRNSATRHHAILKSKNSGLSSLMSKLTTDAGDPVFVIGKPCVKSDKAKGRAYRPATWVVDLFAHDELTQEMDGLGNKQRGPERLSPDELAAKAILLWESIRGEKWPH